MNSTKDVRADCGTACNRWHLRNGKPSGLFSLKEWLKEQAYIDYLQNHMISAGQLKVQSISLKDLLTWCLVVKTDDRYIPTMS